MFNYFSKGKTQSSPKNNATRPKSALQQGQTSVWDEIMKKFYALPKEKQDEILLRIYKRIYINSKRKKQTANR